MLINVPHFGGHEHQRRVGLESRDDLRGPIQIRDIVTGHEDDHVASAAGEDRIHVFEEPQVALVEKADDWDNPDSRRQPRPPRRIAPDYRRRRRC